VEVNAAGAFAYTALSEDPLYADDENRRDADPASPPKSSVKLY